MIPEERSKLAKDQSVHQGVTQMTGAIQNSVSAESYLERCAMKQAGEIPQRTDISMIV